MKMRMLCDPADRTSGARQPLGWEAARCEEVDDRGAADNWGGAFTDINWIKRHHE